MNSLHQFFFGYFPYICLAVFLVGSLLRFDRDQYTWKTDSSQLLRTGQLRWGSNLFHIGILVIFFGHTVGLLTPPWIYEIFISTADKKLMAISVGGVAGVLGLIGLSLLLLVLYVVQTALPSARDAAPVLAALHPVNAVAMLALGSVIARRGSVARGREGSA